MRIEIRASTGGSWRVTPMRRSGRPHLGRRMRAALAGRPRAAMIDAGDPAEAVGTRSSAASLVQEYLPIVDSGGEPIAVVACGATPRSWPASTPPGATSWSSRSSPGCCWRSSCSSLPIGSGAVEPAARPAHRGDPPRRIDRDAQPRRDRRPPRGRGRGRARRRQPASVSRWSTSTTSASSTTPMVTRRRRGAPARGRARRARGEPMGTSRATAPTSSCWCARAPPWRRWKRRWSDCAPDSRR